MDIAKSTRVGLAKFDKKQVWLAYKLVVSKQHISHICSGKSSISMAKIKVLAEAFGVEVSVFISWGE